MYGIDVLIKEHDNILVFTKYVRKLCCDVIDGKQVNIPAFQSCINFARNYERLFIFFPSLITICTSSSLLSSTTSAFFPGAIEP